MRATNISNVGARAVSFSPLSKGSGLIPGSYDIPAVTLRAMAVYTNTMPTQAYRSSGRPEVTYAVERLIDRAALELGFDRIKLRRRNLIKPAAMPYRNGVGMLYDSGRYAENMDWAMEIADWKGFEQRRREAKKRGKLLGRGLANYVESSIGAPNEQTRFTVLPEGRVDVVIGTQPSGQGHETSFAQVVSDLLRVPGDAVKIIYGDTDVVKAGGGTHSGRSMRHAATVFSLAAAELIAKAKRIAAIAFDTAPSQVEFNDGRFSARDTNRTFDFFELARETAQLDLQDDLKGGLTVVTDNEMHDPVFPNGCAICEVEVDPATGEVKILRYASVDDVGRCINPLIVHGQTHGAIAQGVGQAMWEQVYVEPDSGQPLTGSLMDYGMPRADTLPSFRTEIAEVLSPTNPLGIKAGGEGGTTAAPAVMISGILDALHDLGVRDLQMPATPFAIWQAIQAAKAASPQGSQHDQDSAVAAICASLSASPFAAAQERVSVKPEPGLWKVLLKFTQNGQPLPDKTESICYSAAQFDDLVATFATPFPDHDCTRNHTIAGHDPDADGDMQRGCPARRHAVGQAGRQLYVRGRRAVSRLPGHDLRAAEPAEHRVLDHQDRRARRSVPQRVSRCHDAIGACCRSCKS